MCMNIPQLETTEVSLCISTKDYILYESYLNKAAQGDKQLLRISPFQTQDEKLI